MSDYEVALVDAIRTIFKILIGKGIISGQVAAEMLGRQREMYQQDPPMPGAIFVMHMLVESLTDPGTARSS
jgi:hypothetical protein